LLLSMLFADCCVLLAAFLGPACLFWVLYLARPKLPPAVGTPKWYFSPTASVFLRFLSYRVHFRVDCCVGVPLWYSWASVAHFLRHIPCVLQEVETLLLSLFLGCFPNFLYYVVKYY